MSKFSIMRLLVAIVPCLMISSVYAGNTTSEQEPNNPIASPEKVEHASNETIQAVLGNGGFYDLDYYTFYAKAGDVVTADIDHGIGGQRSVDTVMAIFDSSADHNILRFNDDASSLDPGSISRLDSRIDNFVAPVTGYYVVGVSNYPRYFTNGGGVINSWYPAQGDYDLVITGATDMVKHIAILIKPGNNNIAPVNPKSHGKIPVAILGEPNFDVKTIDTTSLTFGSDGTEASLSKCNREAVDLNGDGEPDLLCHFNTQDAQFKPTDAEGKLKGETKKGVMFEGAGFLKVVPMKGGAH